MGIVINHVEGSGPLGRAVGLGQTRIDDDVVSVLGHQMSQLKRLLPQLWLSRSGLPLRQGARGTSNGSRLLSPKRQLQENRE